MLIQRHTRRSCRKGPDLSNARFSGDSRSASGAKGGRPQHRVGTSQNLIIGPNEPGVGLQQLRRVRRLLLRRVMIFRSRPLVAINRRRPITGGLKRDQHATNLRKIRAQGKTELLEDINRLFTEVGALWPLPKPLNCHQSYQGFLKLRSAVSMVFTSASAIVGEAFFIITRK